MLQKLFQLLATVRFLHAAKLMLLTALARITALKKIRVGMQSRPEEVPSELLVLLLAQCVLSCPSLRTLAARRALALHRQAVLDGLVRAPVLDVAPQAFLHAQHCPRSSLCTGAASCVSKAAERTPLCCRPPPRRLLWTVPRTSAAGTLPCPSASRRSARRCTRHQQLCRAGAEELLALQEAHQPLCLPLQLQARHILPHPLQDANREVYAIIGAGSRRSGQPPLPHSRAPSPPCRTSESAARDAQQLWCDNKAHWSQTRRYPTVRVRERPTCNLRL